MHHAPVTPDGRTVRAAALAAGVAAIGVAVRPLREWDAALFADVNAGHGPTADRLFSRVTELGSLYAAGALAAMGRRGAAVRSLTAAGTTWVVGQALKKVVDRPRPFLADAAGTRRMIAPPAGTSWPSSHPAVLTTFTRVAARELALGPATRALLTGLDLTVATSRVYLGVHYPSDVAGGLLLGRCVAAIWPGRRA